MARGGCVLFFGGQGSIRISRAGAQLSCARGAPLFFHTSHAGGKEKWPKEARGFYGFRDRGAYAPMDEFIRGATRRYWSFRGGDRRFWLRGGGAAAFYPVRVSLEREY